MSLKSKSIKKGESSTLISSTIISSFSKSLITLMCLVVLPSLTYGLQPLSEKELGSVSMQGLQESPFSASLLKQDAAANQIKSAKFEEIVSELFDELAEVAGISGEIKVSGVVYDQNYSLFNEKGHLNILIPQEIKAMSINNLSVGQNTVGDVHITDIQIHQRSVSILPQR